MTARRQLLLPALVLAAGALCAVVIARAAPVTVTAIIPGVCGNGKLEWGEQCDGLDFGGATCESIGYASGMLTCQPDCMLDTSACIPFPPGPGGSSGYTLPLPVPPTSTSTGNGSATSAPGTPSAKPPTPPLACDFNSDGHCNLIDLSILLFHFHDPFPAAARYDLDGSGELGLGDISILFYYWN